MGRGGSRETGQAVEQARGQVESTDSTHLPGFWDRQTRKFWAIKERWAHLSEMRAPAKLFTLHPTQRATNGNSEMPALLRALTPPRKSGSSICSEGPQNHHANQTHTTELGSDALCGDQMSQNILLTLHTSLGNHRLFAKSIIPRGPVHASRRISGLSGGPMSWERPREYGGRYGECIVMWNSEIPVYLFFSPSSMSVFPSGALPSAFF